MTSSGGEDKTGAHEALGAGIDSTSHNGDARAVALRGDLYGYRPSILALGDVMMTCATPFVAAVYGRWGRGKSTFMNSVREHVRGSASRSCIITTRLGATG